MNRAAGFALPMPSAMLDLGMDDCAPIRVVRQGTRQMVVARRSRLPRSRRPDTNALWQDLLWDRQRNDELVLLGHGDRS